MGSSIYSYVVVYDPSGPFVTGGGWLDSPVGACQNLPAAGGRAELSVVAQYRKGATAPSGNLELRFAGCDIKLHSDRFEWLVVTPVRVQLAGTGTVAGIGEVGFMLAGAVEGNRVDRLWITLWDTRTNSILYSDNQGPDELSAPAAPIAGGRLTVHKK